MDIRLVHPKISPKITNQGIPLDDVLRHGRMGLGRVDPRLLLTPDAEMGLVLTEGSTKVIKSDQAKQLIVAVLFH